MSQQQKYENKNPLHQHVLQRFLYRIKTAVQKCEAQSVLEVGCADGYVYEYLKEQGVYVHYTGVDVDIDALGRAQKRFKNARFIEGDVRNIHITERFDMVMVLEVLEHVREYEQALRSIKQLNTPYILLSVPNEPYFRILNFLRGRHWKRFGNHPEHVNVWSKRQFKNIVRKHFRIEEDLSSFPWTILLVSKYE